MSTTDTIQIPRELLEGLAYDMKASIASLEKFRKQAKESDMDFNPMDYIDPVIIRKKADLRAVEELLKP